MPIHALAYRKEREELVTFRGGGLLNVFEKLGADPLERLSRPLRLRPAACFSADGKFAAFAEEREAILWNLEEDREEKRLKDWPGPLTASLAFSPEMDRLAAGSETGKLSVWDLRSGRETMSVSLGKRAVSRVRFSPDGRRLLCAVEEGVRVVNAADGAVLLTIPLKARAAFAALTPDRRFVLTAGLDGGVALWDGASGQAHWSRTLPGAVLSADLSADGKTLLTANSNGTAFLFRIPDGPR